MNSHPLRPIRRSLSFMAVLYHNLQKYSNELIVNSTNSLVQLVYELAGLVVFLGVELSQRVDCLI